VAEKTTTKCVDAVLSGDQGEWIRVFNCSTIYVSIVLTGSFLPVLLINEEEGGSLRGRGFSYCSISQVFIDEFLRESFFFRVQGVDFRGFRDEAGFHVNFMVPGLLFR